MKFSEDTISILKNFYKINPSILFRPGNELRTVALDKSVVAEATIAEDISRKAGVYDLNKFLSAVTTIEDADIEFKEEKFVIRGNRQEINYTYTGDSMIYTIPEDGMKRIHGALNEVYTQANVAWEDLQMIMQAAGVLQLTSIRFVCDGQKLFMAANDLKNPTADSYTSVISDDVDGVPEFDLHIKVQDLKLYPGNYDVTFAPTVIRFVSPKVTYYIACGSSK